MTDAGLLLIAHGSRDPEAAATCEGLRDLVRRSLPDTVVELSYLSHTRPTPAHALTRFGTGPVVLVPLLLAAAYHVHVDIEAVAASARAEGRDVRVAGALVGHRDLLDVLVDRIAEAGMGRLSPLTLAASGTSDPAANTATRGVADHLAERLGVVVKAAFVTTLPSLSDALAGGATRGVITFVLAPGGFARDIAEQSTAARVPHTGVLGVHAALARALTERYRDALAVPVSGDRD